MNVYYELGDLKFVWDSDKAEINLKKHKVSFETAARVFLDENAYDDYDELHSDFEDRIKIVGKIGEILTVIYPERGDRNRIISARPADKDERRNGKPDLNLCDFAEKIYNKPQVKKFFERLAKIYCGALFFLI